MKLSKPFLKFVAEEELDRTGDARKFMFVLAWKYSGTQEAVDSNRGVDGLAEAREREATKFQRHIEREFAAKGERLYEVEGKSMLVAGKAAG